MSDSNEWTIIGGQRVRNAGNTKMGNFDESELDRIRGIVNDEPEIEDDYVAPSTETDSVEPEVVVDDIPASENIVNTASTPLADTTPQPVPEPEAQADSTTRNEFAPQGFLPVTDEEASEAARKPGPDDGPVGFNTPEEQLIPDMERALKFSQDPEADKMKAMASAWYADRLGADPLAVMMDFEEYTKQYHGETMLPQTAWGLISDDFKRGVGAVQLGHLGLGLMLSDEPDIQKFQQILDVIQKMPPVTDQNAPWFVRALGDVANFGPTMMSSVGAGLVSSRVGGFFGPKGAAMGFVLGSAMEGFTLAGGNIFVDLATMEHPESGEPMYQYLFQRPDNMRLNQETGNMEPIDNIEDLQKKFLTISKAFASGGGLVSAIMEIPQADLLTGGKVLNDIIGKNLTDIAQKAFSDSVIRNSFSRFVVNYGVNVAAETLQEGIQETVEWWSTEIGKRNIADQLKLAGVEQEGIDIWLKHVNEVFKTTSNAMLFMALPGSARMSGAQAIYDKREALNTPDLQWEANEDSTFLQTQDIGRTANPTQAEVTEVNRAIETNASQKPIRVIEGPDGNTEVDPADGPRLVAYEARGIENVPVEVIPWQAEMEENMTPARLAQLNDFKQMNGAIVTPNNKTIERLVEQSPETFQVTDQGVQMLDNETQAMVPIQSEAKVAIDTSGIAEVMRQMSEKIEDMPDDLREGVLALADKIRDAERTGNLYDLRKSLKDDNIFGDVHLQWFADNDPETARALEEAISSVEETTETLVPERMRESQEFLDATVPALAEVEDQRSKYNILKDEKDSLRRIAKTEGVVSRLKEIDVEMDRLQEFQADEREQAVENAVTHGVAIPDQVLNQYKDREWAQNEIAHRAVLKTNEELYADAGAHMGDVDGFMAYVMTDFYWNGKEAEYETFKDLLPKEPEARRDFFEDMIDNSYYKTERNLDGFIDAVSTNEGVLSWLARMPYENIRSSGMNKTMQFAVSSIGRSLAPTEEMLDAVRAELTKNAGYWQPLFFELAAQKDPQINRQWQAQKDYEYLAQVRKPDAMKAAQDLIDRAEERGVTLKFYVEEDRGIAFLGRIQTPADKQGQGLATETMDEVIEYADEYGLQVQLSPTDLMGSNEKRLIDFYKRFGFVENKGKTKNKEVSNTMYRDPSVVPEAAMTPALHKALSKLFEHRKKYAAHNEQTDMFRDPKEVATRNRLGSRYENAVTKLIGDRTLKSAYREFNNDYVENGKISDYVAPEVIPNEETTDAELDKKISKADQKILNLKDALKSARQEAKLLKKETEAIYKDTLKSAREEAKFSNMDKVEALKDALKDARHESTHNNSDKVKALEEALNSAKQEATMYANMKAKQAERETRAKEQAKAKERLDRKINDLKEKYRKAREAKLAAKRLKELKLKLAKSISKPPAMGINVRIRDKIENLQGLLNPKFTTAAGVKVWEAEFQRIVNGYKDVTIENMVSKYNMSPRPLNLWTVDELTRLNEYIEDLRRDGKTYQEELDEELRAHYREVRKEYIDSISDGPPLPPEGTVEGSKARKSGFIKYAQFWTWRPSRIFRMLDNWTEGKFYDFFITEVNEKMDDSIRRTHERRLRGDQKRAELGLSIQGLAKQSTFMEMTFSRDAMIHIYLAGKNEKSALALINGNNIPPDIITMVQDDLSAEEKAWGDYMLMDFSENYQRLANVYELYMNEHMGQEKAYFPMIRTDTSWEKQDAEFWDQFKLRNEYRQTYVDRGFTMNRMNNKNQYQAGIKLGASHIWSEQVEKHEHWIAMGMHVKGMNNIVKRYQFKDPFVSKFGLQGWNFMTKYIEDVANPTLYKANNGISQVSRRLRKNAAIAYLSYNMLTMAKQIPSLALFLKEVGPLRLLASAAKYTSGGLRWRDFVNMRDPQMLERAITKEIELIRRKEKGAVNRVVSEIGEVGMKGITTIDSIVTHIGWLAVYDKYVNVLGEKEAVRRAQMTVLETQPSARAKDLAQLYKTGEGFNWFTMFSNQLNNIWNMTTADTTYLFKTQQYGKLTGTVAGVGISTICMMLLGGWRPGDDEEDFGIEFLRSGVNMVPFVGKGISAGIQGYRSGGTEPLPIGGEFGNAIREGIELDGEEFAEAIYDIALAAGVTAGVPTTGLVRRPVKAIQEKDPLELLGPSFRED